MVRYGNILSGKYRRLFLSLVAGMKVKTCF